MKLAQLLSLYSELKLGRDPNIEVSGICADSRQLQPRCVFVAIRGLSHDGHRNIQEACAKGAAALIVEESNDVPADYLGAVVKVADTRAALDDLCSRYYGYPARHLFCVGVTGTNGKTTTTHMVEAVLNHFGWPTGVLGTIDHHLGEHKWESQMTTPDPLVLQKRLAEFLSLKAKAVSFEVSSHALDQRRVERIPFDVAVFTNLTRDHLDYHKTMDAYFKAKEHLFAHLLGVSSKGRAFAIVNCDDEYGRKLFVHERAKKFFYGQNQADFQFKVRKNDFSGSEFHLKTPFGEGVIKTPMPGLFNVYNSVAAIGVGLVAGASFETCRDAIAQFHGVKGRLESVANSSGFSVFIDYAHTDDALRNVLSSLQKIRTDANLNSRIITVFGCGGDRDPGKRPMMAKAASEFSDLVIATSDNPRTEDPQQILKDIEKGFLVTDLGQRVFMEVDREKAIGQALDMAKPGDVVLVAGKGHEEYQIIGTEKRPFSDRKVVERILK